MQDKKEKVEKLVEELDLETVEPENKEEEGKGESKGPTSVGLKENLANSGAEAKKEETTEGESSTKEAEKSEEEKKAE